MTPEPSIPRPRPRRSIPDPAWVHQFLIVLTEVEPIVWRRIQVPAAYSFWDLHVAIQDAMGWLDYHLHEFRILHPKRGRIDRLGIPGDEFIDERPCKPDWDVPLAQYVETGMHPISYEYDFGDDWRHTVIQAGKLRHKPHIPLLREDNVRTGFFEADQYAAVLAFLPEPMRPPVKFALRDRLADQ